MWESGGARPRSWWMTTWTCLRVSMSNLYNIESHCIAFHIIFLRVDPRASGPEPGPGPTHLSHCQAWHHPSGCGTSNGTPRQLGRATRSAPSLRKIVCFLIPTTSGTARRSLPCRCGAPSRWRFLLRLVASAGTAKRNFRILFVNFLTCLRVSMSNFYNI